MSGGSATNAAGTVIGRRYRLEGVIGEGGMGVVHRATDQILRRAVAVKEVRMPAAGGEANTLARERVLREARAAGRVHHPGVVGVLDVIDDGELPWIVMELVEGEPLSAMIEQTGGLPGSEVAKIGVSLAYALDAAHRLRVVHRDVKPSNVLVTPDGTARLTDFGIAIAEGDPRMTRTGEVIGSPAYLAPERAKGEAGGPPCDVWGLGATLYAAVEGAPPFDGRTPVDILTAVVDGDLRPPRRAGPLWTVLEAMLAPAEQDRPSLSDVRAQLREIAEGDAEASPAAPRTPVPPPAPEPVGAAEPPAPPLPAPPAPAPSPTRVLDELELPSAQDLGRLARAAAARSTGRPRPLTEPRPPAAPTRPVETTRVATPPTAPQAPVREPAQPEIVPIDIDTTMAGEDEDLVPGQRVSTTVVVAPPAAGGRPGGATNDLDDPAAYRGSGEAWASRTAVAEDGAAGGDTPADDQRRPSESDRARARAAEAAARQARAQAERRAVVALVSIIVALAIALLLVRVTGPDRSGDKATVAATGTAPAVAPAAAGSASPTAEDLSPAADPPLASDPTPIVPRSGWSSYRDPSGWSIAYPALWQVNSAAGGLVEFRDPSTGTLMRVGSAAAAPASVMADWLTNFNKVFAGQYQGYRRTRLESRDGRTGAKDADLEFTGTQNGVSMHVLDRGTNRNGHGYLLYWQSSAQQWVNDQSLRRQMYASFRPAA